jgi:heme exporter protein A
MIEAKQLVKRFGKRTALDLDEWRVSEGEFVALVGPNGAGKTTLLKVLACLVRPSAGEVLIGGKPLESARMNLGVVSHQSMLYADLSPLENLRFFGRLYSVDSLEARTRQVLEQVGMSARQNDPLRTLSRGMQQRVAIGRAVLHNPQILLLDEPHTGLDQSACDMLDETLKSVCGEGRTVVMATHDLVRLAGLASRFDVLARGKLAASRLRSDIPADGLLELYREALG